MGVSSSRLSVSQFAVLLILGNESQNLIWRHDALIVKVHRAVLRRLLQEVAIVHHGAAGVRHAPGAGVGAPVQSPHGGAVLQVKVGHRVESVASPFLPVEVPGTETHQDGLQDTGQPLRAHPFAGADQLSEGVDGLGPRGGVSGLLHLLPLLLREEVRAPAFLSVLAEEALEPGGEARDGWQAGELGHVRELALEDMRRQESRFNPWRETNVLRCVFWFPLL